MNRRPHLLVSLTFGLFATAIATAAGTPAGGGGVTAYTDETAYLDALRTLGYTAQTESFENDSVWGAARSPATQASVSSQGITWSSNHAANKISTSTGAAFRGTWGFYSLPHGNYAAGAICDQPNVCGDGWRGTSSRPLVAIGGWVRSVNGRGQMVIILDGDRAGAIGFDGTAIGSGQFFGVIAQQGFRSFEFFETEGTREDQAWIFGDAFSFAFGVEGEVVPYGCGVNPPSSMVVQSGTPSIGTTISLGVDNPLSTQAVGSVAVLFIAGSPDPAHPCGTLLPGWGMSGAGANGELLVSLAAVDLALVGGSTWTGAGHPVAFALPIPDVYSLVGRSAFAQGIMVDLTQAFGVMFGLTDALELKIGL